MIMKSEDLRRSVNEIDHLLEVLRGAGARGEQDIEEIELLERSRQSILSLLESRRTQNRLPVVSLQAWRDGSLIVPPFSAERYSPIAQTEHPAPGAPQLYRVF